MVSSIAITSASFTLAVLSAAPAFAAEVLITQQKAQQGGITPGDNPGFPVTISRAGRYRLDGNLLVSDPKNGIQVSASFVTIDFNGFALRGEAAALIGVNGGNRNNVTLQNGDIAGFSSDGVRFSGDFWTIERMRITGTGSNAISAETATYVRLVDSTVSGNGDDGLWCGGPCHVEGNLISGNNSLGINIGAGMVLGNTVFGNSEQGIFIGQGGYGNNVLYGNNGDDPEVTGGGVELTPNACEDCP